MTEYKIKLLQDIQAEKAEINEQIHKTLKRIDKTAIEMQTSVRASLMFKCCPDAVSEAIGSDIDWLSRFARELRDNVQRYNRLDQAEDKLL